MNIKKETNKYICIIFIFTAISLCTSCMDIDSDIANTTFGLTALRYEYIIVLLSMIGGYILVIGGIIIMILGLNGNIDWIVNAEGLQSRLVNASPGLVMVIVGAYILYKRKMNIKATKNSSEKKK